MFDIGFSEIVLLIFVGLVVLGPKRLPLAIRTVMGWIKAIRGLAANIQNELKQELKLQELQESIKKAEQFNLKQLAPELNETVEELKKQAKKIRSDLEEKAIATGTTVEEQIKSMNEGLNVPAHDDPNISDKSVEQISRSSSHKHDLSNYYPPDDDSSSSIASASENEKSKS